MLTPPLSFAEKFNYALGDTASNFFFQFFGIFIIYYYTDVYGLSTSAVTTMLLTAKNSKCPPGSGLLATSANPTRFR